MKKVREAKKSLGNARPTAEEVLEHIKQSSDKVSQSLTLELVEKYLSSISANHPSLNAPVKQDSSLRFDGYIGDTTMNAEELLSEKQLYEQYEALLAKVLKTLDDLAEEYGARNARIFRLVLGFEGDLSYQDIGERFSIKKQYVGYIKKQLTPRFLELTSLSDDQFKMLVELLKLERTSVAA